MPPRGEAVAALVVAPARAGAALAVAALLAGCTSGGSPEGSSTPLPLSSASSSSDSAPASTDSPSSADTSSQPGTSTASAGAATSPAGPATGGPSTASGGPTASQVSEPGCRTADLGLQVVREASSNQHAYANVILVNKGPAACSLAGFPGVSLLAAGAQVGPDATRAKTGYSAVSIQPGQSAHATLSVSTACNAARSDSVRVYPPNNTAALTAPLVVYACDSEVSPVSAGST